MITCAVPDNNVTKESLIEKSRQIMSSGEFSRAINQTQNAKKDLLDDSPDLTITNTIQGDGFVIDTTVPIDNITVKEEVAKLETKRQGKNIKFSSEEDKFLFEGMKKHGRKAWALILKDETLNFHASRTRDSLRMRADSSVFRKMHLNV